MRTKQNRKKRTRKQKGRGVGMMKEIFDSLQRSYPDTKNSIYSKGLHIAHFTHVSSGSFGYTYIAELKVDFGFRNERGEPVHKFLVKVVPLDPEERYPYFFMRKRGHKGKNYVVPTYEAMAQEEFRLQRLLYQRGLERGLELCPSPLHSFRSTVPELPPALLAELEFAMDEDFTTIIPHAANPFRVNLIVMELYEDAVTIHSIIHREWDDKIIRMLEASTDISRRFEAVDTDTVEVANMQDTKDFRYSSKCVQLLLARVRRHFMTVYDCGIRHGDPNLSNCLINTRGKITVIDFGLAREEPELAMYRGLDDPQKIHFILNSCEYPNYEGYKWLYKNYYHEQLVTEKPKIIYRNRAEEIADRKKKNEEMKKKITDELFLQPNLLPHYCKVFYDKRNATLTYNISIPGQPRRATTNKIDYTSFSIMIASEGTILPFEHADTAGFVEGVITL
jgi:tRNA A-37 threonylcarbamoyl transferase component Bud32